MNNEFDYNPRNDPYAVYERTRETRGQRSWVLDNWVIILFGLAILGKAVGIIKVPWSVIIVPMILLWIAVYFIFTQAFQWV